MIWPRWCGWRIWRPSNCIRPWRWPRTSHARRRWCSTLIPVRRRTWCNAASLLVFQPTQVVSRFEKIGDLFAPVITLKQRLPDLKAGAVAKEPERIEIAAQADEEAQRPRKALKKKSGPKKPVRKKSRKV